jgi:alpha-glucosidase
VVAPIDMPAVVAYGQQKGVGIWLYVNLQSLVKQADEIFPLYKKWGIKGIKFGFVQVGSQHWTSWVEEAIKKCAANDLMVNIHDDWRPTGEMRTYPNLMTAEGIRGNEEMPDATHNVTLPFTRYISGAADYTICYYTNRIKTTHAHQLAMAAVYYSPIQTLFWYDKPSQSKDEPELEFWRKIPTTWDETKVVNGKIGEYVTIARRSGNDWFLGSMTNNTARKLNLDFGFLAVGKKYKAHLYFDDATATTVTKVGLKTISVDYTSKLEVDLLASGGYAIWFEEEK